MRWMKASGLNFRSMRMASSKGRQGHLLPVVEGRAGSGRLARSCPDSSSDTSVRRFSARPYPSGCHWRHSRRETSTCKSKLPAMVPSGRQLKPTRQHAILRSRPLAPGFSGMRRRRQAPSPPPRPSREAVMTSADGLRCARRTHPTIWFVALLQFRGRCVD